MAEEKRISRNVTWTFIGIGAALFVTLGIFAAQEDSDPDCTVIAYNPSTGEPMSQICR